MLMAQLLSVAVCGFLFEWLFFWFFLSLAAKVNAGICLAENIAFRSILLI
jgi:hypothetical protein